MKNTGQREANGKRSESATKGKSDHELDALFMLPVAEFTAARNELAAQLKKSGKRDESERVKALAKPSVTAWAVNQLYWQHREVFDQLIATGQRFRKAQAGAKVADMRDALDARRESLLELSELATELLGDAGHNPTPETIHRISTTLEAISAYATFSDDLRPGHLSRDIDPPGFDSMSSMLTGATMTQMKAAAVRATSSQKSAPAASARSKTESSSVTRKLEETRQAKIAAAKASVQQAKSLLTEARATAQRLETAQKKASADAKQAEKHRREAEERLEKIRVASESANRRARSVAEEAEEAVKAVEDAKRDVESAAKELEKLFGE